MFCLLPLLLIGYAQSIDTPWHHNRGIGGAYAEVQTCKEGLGARIAGSNQWIQVGPQYGHTITLTESLSLTAQIHGGLGYSNTHYDNHRQITLYNGGVAILLSYQSYSVKIGVDHMSNGRGFVETNRGQDMATFALGKEF